MATYLLATVIYVNLSLPSYTVSTERDMILIKNRMPMSSPRFLNPIRHGYCHVIYQERVESTPNP